MRIEKDKIELEVEVCISEQEYCITSDKYEFTKGAIASGKNKEEAENEFWNHVNILHLYYKKRADELDKWKPLQIGPWGIGGKWFTIYGIQVYFRYGKNMKYGWYIPFTKLNVMITNHWLK